MKKWISGLMLALGLCTLIQSKVEANCCYDYCDDYCAGPLSPCSFGIQLKGGVAPTHYTDRGRVWLTDPSLAIPVFSSGRGPKFSKQFDTPWEVALELSYAVSDHAQVFLEGVYQKADGKHNRFDRGTFEYRQRHSDYETWGGYLGARYFFNKWFCCVAPFIGFKAGFVNSKRVHYNLDINDVFVHKSTFFRSHTGPSVGAQIGLDYNFCCNWNAVLTLEAVASHGLRSNRNVEIPVSAPGGITNVSLADTGYLVSFPITLGIRYDF